MEGPSVRITSRVSAHESFNSVIDSIKGLFPDFIPENHFENTTYPKKDVWSEIYGNGGSMDYFIQALREQRILDTAMDAMTMDSTENSTLFRLSRQASIVGKVGFILEGETTLGGHFDVLLELPGLISWIEKATYHEGRNHVPRRVGDGFGMEMDGSSREWND